MILDGHILFLYFLAKNGGLPHFNVPYKLHILLMDLGVGALLTHQY
jgi:hypothetical protein